MKALKIFRGMLMTVMLSVALQFVAGVPLAFGLAGFTAAGEFMAGLNMSGTLMAGLYPEAWTGELVKRFRHTGTFLERIRDYSQYVRENNTMHLVDVGVDPDVLIDNSTYPIAVNASDDSDISITLVKFDTENTKITDDELRGIGYDKIGLKVEQHKLALEEKTLEKALHSLCPAANTTGTPVIATTGASNGEAQARKRLQPADLIKMKRKFDDLKIPKMGREIVLCNQHVEDLLLTSQAFKDQYYNIKEGSIPKLFGFDISECTYNPIFNSAAKAAFGAAAVPATDQNVSVVMYRERAVKALGKNTTKAYLREAKNDPENRMNTLGYRLYHICIPKKAEGFGAIISGIV